MPFVSSDYFLKWVFLQCRRKKEKLYCFEELDVLSVELTEVLYGGRKRKKRYFCIQTSFPNCKFVRFFSHNNQDLDQDPDSEKNHTVC